MKVFIAAVLLLVLPLTGFSQSPAGYQGLKTRVGYNFSLAPNCFNLAFIDGGIPLRNKSTHSFGIHNVISRKWTGGVEFSSSTAYSGHFVSLYSVNSYYTTDVYAPLLADANTFSLVFTHYGGQKGNVPAPIGKFTRLKASWSNIAVFMPLGSIGDKANNYNGSDGFRGPDFYTTKAIGAGLGIGQSSVFFNRALLEYEVSFETNVPISSDLSYLYTTDLVNVLAGTYFLNFRAGISGLLF